MADDDDTHKKDEAEILDEAAEVTGRALPATPDDGPADPARVRAALAQLAELQAHLKPGSDEWAAIGDYAESLVPAVHTG